MSKQCSWEIGSVLTVELQRRIVDGSTNDIANRQNSSWISSFNISTCCTMNQNYMGNVSFSRPTHIFFIIAFVFWQRSFGVFGTRKNAETVGCCANQGYFLTTFFIKWCLLAGYQNFSERVMCQDVWDLHISSHHQFFCVWSSLSSSPPSFCPQSISIKSSSWCQRSKIYLQS